MNAKFFKIQTSSIKNETKLNFFSPPALNLLEEDTLKLRAISPQAQERFSCTPAGFRSFLDL